MTYGDPSQTPLYHAEHADRYERQELIKQYEEAHKCRFVVIFDALLDHSIACLEEMIFDADPSEDLHIMLVTPGGDGEMALRLLRSAQQRCKELTVVVPDRAKSAGTIFALGAHHILMGPTSDLGPVDPQVVLGPNQLVPAKDVLAAVQAAEQAVQERPETYPIHASLLANVNALLVQQARSAMARSADLVREALASNADRSTQQVAKLCTNLQEPLIDASRNHGAVFDADDAQRAELPVTKVDPAGEQWKLVWRLWMKYFVRQERIYEGVRASRPVGMWSSESS
ncbi:MAG: SDH family Clp fold serine proteinase [Acidimicrobiales bacterium]